jgi:hypothetical protein
MAVGFPAKTTYANGDVFSASDINDTNGTLNLVNPATNGIGQSNPVLNSAYQVWQRGTSIAPASSAIVYTADRWCFYSTATGRTVSRQGTSDTTNLPFIQYCARVQRDNGNTSTAALNFLQSFESINSIPFAGKTVTLSFYARRGANYSSASNGLPVYLISGTGTDQNQINGYTGQALPISQTATLTTTWQRFSYTATVATTATELTVSFGYVPVGTAGAADFFEVTGVQLDVGSTATPFRTYAGTIQEELAACQRYFIRTAATPNFGNIGVGQLKSGTEGVYSVSFPTEMRVTPSVTASAANTFVMTNGADASSVVTTAPSLNVGGRQTVSVAATASGLGSGGSGQGSRLLINNAANGFIDFSGEL